MSEPAEPERVLRRTGSVRDHEIDLAEAALALGSLDRPRVSLERYRDHLSELGERICEQGGDIADAEGAADILRQEIAISLGYDGDRLSYDDMQNANLLRVIDRRRGLPVSLAVIYVHAARAAGSWPAGRRWRRRRRPRPSRGRRARAAGPAAAGPAAGPAAPARPSSSPPPFASALSVPSETLANSSGNFGNFGITQHCRVEITPFY